MAPLARSMLARLLARAARGGERGSRRGRCHRGDPAGAGRGGGGTGAVQAELCAYLRRAGIDVPAPVDPPGPWAPTLAGRWHEAAAVWTALGERYEAAAVLATASDHGARARGEDALGRLGALGTLAAV